MNVDILDNISFLLLSIDELPQKIDPEGWGLDPKPGFGYTISKVDTVASTRNLDVDSNECNDFAVGYPESNRVVLLRSKEVVRLDAKDPKSAIKLKPSSRSKPEDCQSLSRCSINPPYPEDPSKYFFHINAKLARPCCKKY